MITSQLSPNLCFLIRVLHQLEKSHVTDGTKRDTGLHSDAEKSEQLGMPGIAGLSQGRLTQKNPVPAIQIYFSPG